MADEPTDRDVPTAETPVVGPFDELFAAPAAVVEPVADELGAAPEHTVDDEPPLDESPEPVAVDPPTVEPPAVDPSGALGRSGRRSALSRPLPWAAVIAGVLLAALAVGVFVVGLQLQLPIWPGQR